MAKIQGFFGKLATSDGLEVTTGLLTADKKYGVKTLGTVATGLGLEAGYVFVADGTEDITASGDVLIEFTEQDNCDISKWGIEYSDPEINVAGLCDKQNVFLAGRTDVSISIEGFFDQGLTDRNGGFLNNFTDIVRQAGPGGAVTIDKIDKSQIYAFLYKQKETNSGDIEQFYVVPAVTISLSDEVDGETAQSFSGSLRPTDDPDGILYQLVNVTHP
jgi:hypothetical protein